VGNTKAFNLKIRGSQFEVYETAVQCGRVSADTAFKASPSFEDWYLQRHPDAIPCNAGEGEV
jgi:hypothetical protein